MSFYGTSFYELKQYFKRFLFQNGTDEPITFEPSDIFDGLKQKSDHWIRFDKDEEELPDGSTADILLISHNIPNKEDIEIGGLRFYQNLEDAYETEIEKKVSRFFKSVYHEKVVKLINNYRKITEKDKSFDDDGSLNSAIENLFKDVEIDLEQDIEIINAYFTDYLKIKVLVNNGTTSYINKSNELIVEHILNLINPNTIASLPDFDIDKRGHMIFKGNKVFTFPDNVIGFIDPNTNEVIKVSPNDAIEGDGSYILFEGNDYIEFVFNEQTGALQIKHKKGYNGDGVERQSAIPKYYNNIQQAIDALTQEKIKDLEGNNYTIDTFREKIQSYRSGNILQVPNFSYDEYGHMVQDQDDPYSYLRLDMADSYQIVNFIITFDKGWELVGDEEGTENDDANLMELNIYKKRVPELMPYISSIETVFNVACDNKTRLKLIQTGVGEFWIDNVQGEPIMFVRGDSSVFNTGNEDPFAFQTQVVSSYESASAAEGINGAVIVTLGHEHKNNYEDPGICSHTYEEIVSYLEMGKMVLCYDAHNKQYYLPCEKKSEHKDWGDYISFSSVTNIDDPDNSDDPNIFAVDFNIPDYEETNSNWIKIDDIDSKYDFDNSGLVDKKDVEILFNKSKEDLSEEENFDNYDINSDGNIDHNDIILLNDMVEKSAIKYYYRFMVEGITSKSNVYLTFKQDETSNNNNNNNFDYLETGNGYVDFYFSTPSSISGKIIVYKGERIDGTVVPSKSWISSTKVIIPAASKLPEDKKETIANVVGNQQFFFKIIDYNLGAKINDFLDAAEKSIGNGQEAINNFINKSNNEITNFINNGQEAINNFTIKGDNTIQYYIDNIEQIIVDTVAEKVAPLYITSVELATLQQIKDGVKVGADIYYQNENGINIPLSGLSDSQAIFSVNTIANGVLTIQTYTINSIGELTTQTHEVATSRMLPTGGKAGQMLMINANGIPEWTSFLRINTADDNLIEYYNAKSNKANKWEPVSASWA